MTHPGLEAWPLQGELGEEPQVPSLRVLLDVSRAEDAVGEVSLHGEVRVAQLKTPAEAVTVTKESST